MNLTRILLLLSAGLVAWPAYSLSLEQTPLFISSTEPRVMLLMSRDHELTKKAYTDYSDLNGDGILDTTYNDAIRYYGYFDPDRCYVYQNNRYEPADPVNTGTHQCSGQWSGNFMNWASMTRMDVARKVLYGGKRFTDNNGSALADTVLERAFIPADVHAFAKVFAPAGGATEVAKYIPATVTSSASVTMCNVTLGSGQSKNVTTATPPLMRLANGSWAQWAFSEVVQCKINNGAITPTAVVGDYRVRVAVCAPGKLETNCKQYGSGAVKPTGLLQRYGDTDASRRIRFGLMTGSYANNVRGGVLRRNTSLIAGNPTASDNEINSSTGQFTNNPGIIDTLNRIQISGYTYSSGYGSLSCGGGAAIGNCKDWGNPLSEMYLETLRYFHFSDGSATTPTSTFATNDSGYMSGTTTLPSATWSDPLPSNEWCALSNIVVFSTGLNSFDGDNLSSSVPTGIDINTLTDMVGSAEGLVSTDQVYAGSNGSVTNNRCQAKSFTGLSNLKGICPEIPAQQGTFKIAGLANANREVDLRPAYQTKRAKRWGSITPINQNWIDRQPLTTYAVQLAETLPSFTVKTESGKPIDIFPYCEANSSGTPCSLTDIQVLSSSPTGGAFLAAWEDQQWGSDYDMDAISKLTWCVGSACSPAKGPDEIQVTVEMPQKVSGATMQVGLITNGTTKDGISFYEFPLSVSQVSMGSSSFGCANPACTASVAVSPGPGGPTTPPTPKKIDYTAGATSGLKQLNSPLWYTAKYGAQSNEWDKDGNLEPDNFFLVRNPAKLEEALAEVFDNASKPDAAASSVATNTANLQIDNYVFQAKFQPTNWFGDLVSIRLEVNPTTNAVTLTDKWNAAPRLDSTAPSSRLILTKGSSGDGASFDWSNLTTAQQTALHTNALGINDGLGSARLNYLRGDDSNEGSLPGQFRQRNKSTSDGSVLGDIVNSGPLYIGKPGAGYSDVDHPGYSAFRALYKDRKPVVYVGANDGMLHGFDAELDSSGQPVATGGDEVIAYVPTQVYGNLSKLTAQNYNKNHRYFVDGTPMAADVFLNLSALGSNNEDKWRTVLIGNMNSGGKGYFALDVTNPNLSSKPAAPFATANAADTLLWEFTDSDDADMGYAYNLPPQYSANAQAKQMAKLQDGKWAAVVGNGYNSANGDAALYLLYIENGVDGSWATTGDYVKVAIASSNNGLSTPVPYDSNGDGRVDVAYAGDLLGQMWRFDLTNPSSPTVSLLFDAGPTKPITTPPEVYSHPAGGTMVLFGTGKYLELTDTSNTDVQTVYGMRDDMSGNTVALANLQEQLISGANRTISQAATAPTVLKGWYMNLPDARERMTGIPKLVNGLLFFNTLIPSSSPCEAGGDGWLMAVDASSGALPSFSVFDYNNDGVFDSGVGGIQIGAALGGTTFIKGQAGSPVGVGVASLTSGQLAVPALNLGAESGGRVNWREILR